MAYDGFVINLLAYDEFVSEMGYPDEEVGSVLHSTRMTASSPQRTEPGGYPHRLPLTWLIAIGRPHLAPHAVRWGCARSGISISFSSRPT